ncbi:Scr1 family TA system antitoxin-like transcriptional regulator [Streptomyces gamaensis]|uniref:Scr1 family TA system antitoxin-like transcriptional regulator n=1 Tax=Streptomyces gamaensis TaxID=1763542 RepID=A0ABW0Z5E5_9ACTN
MIEGSVPPAAEFGREVKIARESRGLSQADLAVELHFQQPYVSKVETGHQLASEVFAEQCDRVFGTPGVYARMRRKAADASNPTWLIPYLQAEREAVVIRDYSPILVPGILQTSGYAEAVYRAARPNDPAHRIEQRVEERMRRWEVFDSPSPPSLWALLHEAALWSSMGGLDVMRGQLQHLAAVAEHPRITVQVFPFSGSVPRATPFILLTRKNRTEVLYEETYARGQLNDSAEAVAEACAAYDRMRANALSLDNSLSLIRHVMEACRHEQPSRPHPRNMGEVQLQPGQRRNLRRVGPHVRAYWRRSRPGQ